MQLMQDYNKRAEESGSGFYMNPSPGNIKDGLITDAIKSAGAAKKAGTSPVVDVLDYPEKLVIPGLNLLCTPGNDVESTTAEVASGANIVLFTTGLGTPTGNPIVPVVKIATNTVLFNKMPDIIDINTGTIIEGLETIEEAGERILDYVIELASGIKTVHAMHPYQALTSRVRQPAQLPHPLATSPSRTNADIPDAARYRWQQKSRLQISLTRMAENSSSQEESNVLRH